MKDNDILQHLTSVPLFADIIRVMTEGKFINPEVSPGTHENAETIGEMNLLEKSLFTLVEQLDIEQQKLKAAILEADGDMVSVESQKQYDALYNKAKTAMDYFWESVKARFPEKCAEGNPVLSIHSDFSIAIRPSDKPEGLFGGMMAINLGSFFSSLPDGETDPVGSLFAAMGIPADMFGDCSNPNCVDRNCSVHYPELAGK